MKDYEVYDILIVEDNSSDAELTVRTLKKQNLVNRIFVAEDGAEALDFIYCRGKFSERDSNRPPKAVFLDLKLPKISGLEVLKVIKSHPDTKSLPVIVISSSQEDPDIKSAYELGANSYVVKPVGFEMFIKAINQTGLYWLLVNEPPKLVSRPA